jgi:hypothetical protein
MYNLPNRFFTWTTVVTVTTRPPGDYVTSMEGQSNHEMLVIVTEQYF